MFDVTFKYADNNTVICQNIVRIETVSGSGYRSIAGDELLNCHLNHGSVIYLYSDSANYSVSTAGLLSIAIKKQ